MRLPDPANVDIVARVLGGDVEAFAGLVAPYRDRLVRYATHMLGDADEAEDVVQDAFVRAYRSLARCADPSRFDAWLFRIVVNRCRTAGARRARRARTMLANHPAMVRAEALEPPSLDGWFDEVEAALRQLEPEQREAFLLRHVEGMSYGEMAVVTGAGESALKMRVKRACDRLRLLLQEWKDD